MIRAGCLILALGSVACHDGRVDLERMIDQRKLEAFEATSSFDDGKAMRSPPPGTVSRDRRDPVRPAVTTELLTRGQRRFDIYCAACHGVLGDGQSQVAENMLLRPPPSLHETRLRALSTERLYGVVRDGYGLMPAYGPALSEEDRWAVVAYVGALQLSQNVELSSLPSNLKQEAAPWLK
jgi:mono/diheme cytochrome c family protein